jgi:hypothetical protein
VEGEKTVTARDVAADSHAAAREMRVVKRPRS